MGYESSRNIRSQFLRGIRDDAKYLGELLKDRRRSTGTPLVKKEAPQILHKPSGVTA